MDRIVSIDHWVRSPRADAARAEQLRHRRAAAQRCVRAGLRRRCTPVPPTSCGARA